MIVVVCIPCAFAIRVMPANVAQHHSIRELRELVGDKSEFWPDKFPCPRCEKHCTGMSEELVDARVYSALTLRDLTPVEAFSAFKGCGLPEEQLCSIDNVREVLSEYPIRKVTGSNVQGQEVAIIDAIELWNGTVLHFAAGPAGAVVYRIVRPVGLAAKVADAPSGESHG
jgi:hypothetical protein